MSDCNFLVFNLIPNSTQTKKIKTESINRIKGETKKAVGEIELIISTPNNLHAEYERAK